MAGNRWAKLILGGALVVVMAGCNSNEKAQKEAEELDRDRVDVEIDMPDMSSGTPRPTGTDE
jgi:hypothetical protein